MRILLLALAGCATSFNPASEFELTEIVDTDNMSNIDISVTPDTSAEQDTSTGDTGQVSPSGLVGGVAQVHGFYVPCPSCFYGRTVDYDTYAGVKFHEPIDASWSDKLPPVGTCAETISEDPVDTSFDIGPSVTLQGSTSIYLPRKVEDGNAKYRSVQFSDTQLILEDYHDLYDSSGLLIAEDVVRIPQGFDWLSPSSMLATDIDNAFSAPIRRNLTNEFTWLPPGNDLFVILLEVYDSTGQNYKGGTICVDNDDGQFLMPVGPLQGFDYGDMVALYMYRWERAESVISTSGDTIEGIGMTGVLGTATLID